MLMQIEVAWLLVYNATWRKEAGLPFLQEAAMSKYFAGENKGLFSKLYFLVSKLHIDLRVRKTVQR